jgi:phosphatidyl-myo-inositol alpha-mannosyltransferase
MKIAIVTPYPIGTDGGVQNHVNYYAQKLIEKGHYVRVFSSSPKSEIDTPWHIKLGKYKVVRGKYLNLLTNGSRTFYTTLGKDSPKLPEKFDIIHVHEPLLPLFYFSRAIVRANKTKAVATVHSQNSVGDSAKPVVQGILKKGFLKYYSAIIPVSEVASTMYQGMGIPLEIIPNGVDANFYTPNGPKVQQYIDGKKNIVFLGRFDPRKGVEYLLQAWPRITEALQNNVRLILVRGGSPEENARIFSIIDTLPNKENIIFEGFVSEDRKRQVLRTADLMIAPSTGGESQGIVLNEAMACGTPVLGFANPGYSWVLADKKDYCLAEVKNVDELSTKAIRILSDDILSRELSEWGIKEVREKFDWGVIADRILKVYERVLLQTK